jgi:hypothetical protein
MNDVETLILDFVVSFFFFFFFFFLLYHKPNALHALIITEANNSKEVNLE